MSVDVFAVLSVVCVWMQLLNVPLVSCGTKCFWQLRTKANLGTSGLRCELERCGSGAPDSGILSRQTMQCVLKASLSSLEKGVCVNSWTGCSSFLTSAEKKKDCRFSKGTWFLCVFIVCACGNQRITFLAGLAFCHVGVRGIKIQEVSVGGKQFYPLGFPKIIDFCFYSWITMYFECWQESSFAGEARLLLTNQNFTNCMMSICLSTVGSDGMSWLC